MNKPMKTSNSVIQFIAKVCCCCSLCAYQRRLLVQQKVKTILFITQPKVLAFL